MVSYGGTRKEVIWVGRGERTITIPLCVPDMFPSLSACWVGVGDGLGVSVLVGEPVVVADAARTVVSAVFEDAGLSVPVLVGAALGALAVTDASDPS